MAVPNPPKIQDTGVTGLPQGQRRKPLPTTLPTLPDGTTPPGGIREVPPPQSLDPSAVKPIALSSLLPSMPAAQTTTQVSGPDFSSMDEAALGREIALYSQQLALLAGQDPSSDPSLGATRANLEALLFRARAALTERTRQRQLPGVPAEPLDPTFKRYESAAQDPSRFTPVQLGEMIGELKRLLGGGVPGPWVSALTNAQLALENELKKRSRGGEASLSSLSSLSDEALADQFDTLSKQLTVLAGQDVLTPDLLRQRSNLESLLDQIRVERERRSAGKAGGGGTVLPPPPPDETGKAGGGDEEPTAVVPRITQPTESRDIRTPRVRSGFDVAALANGQSSDLPVTEDEAAMVLGYVDPSIAGMFRSESGAVIGPNGDIVTSADKLSRFERMERIRAIASDVFAQESDARREQELKDAQFAFDAKVKETEIAAQQAERQAIGKQQLEQIRARGAEDRETLEKQRLADISLLREKHEKEKELQTLRLASEKEQLDAQVALQREVAKMNAALRDKELDEVARSNRAQERLRDEAASAERKQFMYTLLFSLASNPTLLHFASEGGLVKQLGREAGFDTTALETFGQSDLARRLALQTMGISPGFGGIGKQLSRARL